MNVLVFLVLFCAILVRGDNSFNQVRLQQLDSALYACYNDHSRAGPPDDVPRYLLATLLSAPFMRDDTFISQPLDVQQRILWRIAASADDENLAPWHEVLFYARQWYLVDNDEAKNVQHHSFKNNSKHSHNVVDDPFFRDVWSRCKLVPRAFNDVVSVLQCNIEKVTDNHDEVPTTQSSTTGFHVVVGTGPAGSVVTHELAYNLPRSSILIVLEAGPAPSMNVGDDTRSHAAYMEAGNKRIAYDNSIFVRNARVLGGGSTVNLDLAFAPTLPRLQTRIETWKHQGLIIDDGLTSTCVKNASDWVEAQLNTTSIDVSFHMNRNNALLWDGATHSSSAVTAFSYRLNAQPTLTSPEQWSKRSAVHAFLVPAWTDAPVHPHILTHAKVIQLKSRGQRIIAMVIECSLPHGQHGPAWRFTIEKPSSVILAAGAWGSTEILLRSQMYLNNPNVGRGVVLHPSLPLLAKFPFPIDAQNGLSTSVYAVPRNGSDTSFLFESMSADLTYIRRLFPLPPSQVANIARDLRHYGGFGVMLIDTSNDMTNRLQLTENGKMQLYYRLTPTDRSALRRAVTIALQLLFQQGATEILLPTHERLVPTKVCTHNDDCNDAKNNGDCTPDELRLIPLTRADQIDAAMARWTLAPFQTALTSAHMQATNKLGKVVDTRFRFLAHRASSKSQVRPINNLFIVDGSVFPASIGANPMQSIYVMAKLFVKHIFSSTPWMQKKQETTGKHTSLLRAIVADMMTETKIDKHHPRPMSLGVAHFLTDVLCQVHVHNVLELLRPALTNCTSDPYVHTQERFQQTRPWYFPFLQLRAMKRQNKLLGQQIAALWAALARHRRIHVRHEHASNKPPWKENAGCLEIGFPGRHITTNLLPPYANQWKDGQRWVMWETNSSVSQSNWTMSERLQAWSWIPSDMGRGFDHQIPWTNYMPITEETIASRSLDVIVILIGLHHVPQERLVQFCQSLFRMLREGGRLIVREHDASTPHRHFQAQAAHTLFNLIASGASAVEDRAELRNFRPLDEWISVLTDPSVGFRYDAFPFLQHNDPTFNTLCSFERPLEELHVNSETLLPSRVEDEDKMMEKDTRDLTMAEWYSVQLADEYAAFIHHTPWYQFPYLATAQTMNKLAWASMWHTHSKDVSYMLMNMWVCLTTTIQHTALAVVAVPFSLIYGTGEHDESTVGVLISASEQDIIACTQGNPRSDTIVFLPRYTAFLAPFRALCACLLQRDPNFFVSAIHGQDKIIVQFVVMNQETTASFSVDVWNEHISSWKSPTAPSKQHVIIRIHVRDLVPLVLSNNSETQIVKLYES